MALLRYFKPVNGHLPDPAGPLSADIPPPAIRQANLDVLSVEKQDASAKTRARGSYGRLTDKQRAQIGKYASENGNAAAVRRFSKELDRPLNESTVRSIKNYYEELGKKRSSGDSLGEAAVTSLPPKKRGRLWLHERLVKPESFLSARPGHTIDKR